MIKCTSCELVFESLDGELHPHDDAVICPNCGVSNLFSDSQDFSWESLRQDIFDSDFEAGYGREKWMKKQ